MNHDHYAWMRSGLALAVCIWSLDSGWPGEAASPAIQVLKAGAAGPDLLKNGSFEAATGARAEAWATAPQGALAAPGEGRGGSWALRCENREGTGWYGVSQTVTLNRTNILPIVIQGWSKATNVSGSADSGYSLYADLLYDDNTPLWGQTVNFRCGTHDWEQRELVILPAKPVKQLTLHCLLRGHTGTVWFDDVAAHEVAAGAGALLLQGVAVVPPKARRRPAAGMTRYATSDGLELTFNDHAVAGLSVDGRDLHSGMPGGFLARDVAGNSDFYGFTQGACSELGLRLETKVEAAPGHIAVQGRITDTTQRDRAVTLLFALPVNGAGWRWGDDIRTERVVQGLGEFANTVGVRCGSTGTMSLYPLGVIHDDRSGLALAIDMAQPAQFRLAYHAGTRQLLLAYDFGLVGETERFSHGASFRFVIFRFDPTWGFRSAFQKLMTIFPDQFVVRSREQGIWMPFTDISKVEGWEDFGFRYHEGNNNVPFDDAHGVLSFRYTEPMTWWMRMNPAAPRTMAGALSVRAELAQGSNQSERQMAEASQAAGMFDEAGEPCLLFREEPWCRGAVWSLNPNPFLPGPWNGVTVHWNDATRQALYGTGAKGELDGEYLDSLEGYVTADLNFRRDHFRNSTVPLTFDTTTKRPALFKGLAVFEFTKWFADEIHRLGKLTFANGVPYRFSFLCPWLDVLGTETDWLPGGRYRPVGDAQLCLWRTMSGQKPYLLLMNTDFAAFGPDLVEKYFQRSLAYGFFPGMFSHNAADNPYWQNPKWYNRDRPLFKKYLPLIRQVAEAGWQPVTGATCDPPEVTLERFGPRTGGPIFWTVCNPGKTAQVVTVRVQPGLLADRQVEDATELVAGLAVARAEGGWRLELAPETVKVLAFKPGAGR